MTKSSSGLDLGLLVLRGAGLFLLLTFGWQKFWDYGLLVRAGVPLANAGLAPLIRSMGFPAPVLLGFYATACESLCALLIAFGFYTRMMAAFAALSMAGAFYTSLRLHEEPLRASAYLCIFLALVLTGPGRFSIDQVLGSRTARQAGDGRTAVR
jgi:putative oxidoreductase